MSLSIYFHYRSIDLNESQSNSTSDRPINGDVSVPTATNLTITETLEVQTLPVDHSHIHLSSLPSRATTKISREYLTQHINYRAQRLASKVEPDMVDF